MILSLVLLFIFKILILNIIKFDSGIFKDIQKSGTDGSSTNILQELSAKAIEKGKKEVTTQDLTQMIFSFLGYRKGILFALKLFTVSILVAILFAIVVAPPNKMKTHKQQNANVRLFLITLFTKMLLMFTLFIVVTNLLSI